MNREQLYREFAELNGIHLHDTYWYDGPRDFKEFKCRICGKTTDKYNLDDPTFPDAKSILEVMMKRDDWFVFASCLCAERILLYIFRPDKLLTDALEWCREHKDDEAYKNNG